MVQKKPGAKKVAGWALREPWVYVYMHIYYEAISVREAGREA